MKILLLLLVLVSCNSIIKTNQYTSSLKKKKEKQGFWIEKHVSNQEVVLEKGRYKLGKKIGVWKTYVNQKIYQKEFFRKNVTYTKTYFPNGKIMEKGKSKVDMEKEGWHWYYFGKWKYYNEQGQLLKIHIYENGKMVDSIIYKKKGLKI